jgi:hypothetical protein
MGNGEFSFYLLLESLLRLREWNQALTIPCVLAGLAGGAAYFGSMELDATKPIMVGEITPICVLASFISPQGIDPLLFFGGATLGCMGMFKCSSYWSPSSPSFSSYLGGGYLVGPIIGSTLWRVTHRRTMVLIEARDREFHQHIVKNRVDPRAQSATNPVPDFYGEQALAWFYDMYLSISFQEKKLALSININRWDRLILSRPSLVLTVCGAVVKGSS